MPRIGQSAAILLVSMVFVGCGGGGGKTDDAAANQAILSALATYPHARIYDKTVNAYYPEDGAGAAPLGHTTNVDYGVPEGTTQVALVRFYSSRLEPQWHCRTERIGGAVLLLHCKRGAATIDLNPTDLVLGSTPLRYELVVDHNHRTP